MTYNKWRSVFPIQIQTGNHSVFIKLLIPSHAVSNYMELHFWQGKWKKKKKTQHNILEKEGAIWEGQKVGCVTIYHECQLSTELLPPTWFLLHDISVAVIHPFSPTCPSIIAVSLKLQSNSKSLDSTTCTKILSNNFSLWILNKWKFVENNHLDIAIYLYGNLLQKKIGVWFFLQSP